MRDLTEAERVTLINAVQALTGRLDRTIPPDARQAAYRTAAILFTREFQVRYGVPPVQTSAPQLPMFAPPVRHPTQPFDPFA